MSKPKKLSRDENKLTRQRGWDIFCSCDWISIRIGFGHRDRIRLFGMLDDDLNP